MERNNSSIKVLFIFQSDFASVILYAVIGTDRKLKSGAINKYSMNEKVHFFCMALILFSYKKHTNGLPGSNYAITTKDLVKRHGYQVEFHTAITKDGYILTLNKILHSNKNGDNAINKPVVLLVHGLFGSSDNFLVTYRGLAYVLSDSGYDVWLGNCRGNRYSRSHIKLNPDFDTRFWDFSWHEIGVYDLPSMIDYVLEQTKQNQLFYVGHSQGTTTFFVMASERPEYNSKIRLMLALAPVAFGSNSEHSLIKVTSENLPYLENLATILNVHEVLPNNEVALFAARILCTPRGFFRELCANFIVLLSGYETKQLNRTDIPYIVGTVPAGSSIRQVLHYAQNVASGLFSQYDFGKRKNMLKYGSVKPPQYNLRNITSPVALFYSKDDWMALPKDVEKLSTFLSNLVLKYIIPYKNFNHLDFIYAIDAPKLFYNRMIEEMGKFLN